MRNEAKWAQAEGPASALVQKQQGLAEKFLRPTKMACFLMLRAKGSRKERGLTFGWKGGETKERRLESLGRALFTVQLTDR